MLSLEPTLVALLAALTTSISAPSITPRTLLANCPGHFVLDIQQQALFTSFIAQFYIKEDVAGAYNTYVAQNVIELDLFIADGRAAGIAALTPLISAASFQLVHVMFDNGIGSVHSKVMLPGGAPFLAAADYFRYDGSCIVEHWDGSESLPADATSSHPLF